MDWDSYVDPIVVSQANNWPISLEDMCLLNNYLDHLLDLYSDGPGVVEPDKDISLSALAEFKKYALEQCNDINI